MSESLYWFIKNQTCPADGTHLGKPTKRLRSHSGDLKLAVWTCPFCERDFVEYTTGYDVLRRFPEIRCRFLDLDIPIVNKRKLVEMKAVLLFSQRYYFDNRRLPRSITKWLETIKLVSTVRLNSGYEYYLRLYTDMRYVDKVAEVVRARNSCRNLSECANLLSSAIEDPALVANDPRLADYIKNGCEPELPDQPSSIQLN